MKNQTSNRGRRKDLFDSRLQNHDEIHGDRIAGPWHATKLHGELMLQTHSIADLAEAFERPEVPNSNLDCG